MRVLWVIVHLLPEMEDYLGLQHSNFGGWVQSMLKELKRVDFIDIGVVSCASGISKVEHFERDGVKYWLIPICGKNKAVNNESCRYIVEQFKPDLIHIEGTEWSISKQFAELDKVTNLVSLQGILNGYEVYQYGDLPIADYMFSLSPQKIITGWTLFFRKRLLFDGRLETEKDTIKNADNLMGRTLWDRAHSYKFNQTANYYTCNRTLRSIFYEKQWCYENCQKHSIFVGNGYSALKGGHFVIEAVKQLVGEYPDIQLIFAGEDPYIHKKNELKKRIGYSYYLRCLLKDPILKDRVKYIGEQNEVMMAEQLLKANVYVLPSLIENSPNTLGEAMIMGVPCVSAYTGGSGEMAIDEKEAFLYRAGDAVMMAWQIKRVFDLKDSVYEMCMNAQKHARSTHNPEKNLNALLAAYADIVGNNG